MNYLRELGALALASRLKNLSDNLMQGVTRIYLEKNVEFEPRWFPVMHYLFTHGPVPVTALANALRQSHPAILQVTNMMMKNGLIKYSKDENDLRKTIVSLTAKGEEIANGLKDFWDDVLEAAKRLMEESRADLIADIDRIEEALEKEDIYSRVKKEYVRKRLDKLQIKELSAEHYQDFREINYQWLKESVGISAYDEKVLNDPGKEILGKGGRIFLAFAGTEMVGTYTLLPVNDSDIELTKLAVKKPYRQMGIGRLLTERAKVQAERENYKSVILLTHPTLIPAINLYKKAGFIQIPGHTSLPDPTGRCSITMQYIINH